MSFSSKLDLLKQAFGDDKELDVTVGKLLEMTRDQHRLRLSLYDKELSVKEGPVRNGFCHLLSPL